MRITGVTAVGWRAHAALRRAGGRATVLVTLTDSLYAVAGNDLVWIGASDATLHGRTVAGIPLGGAVSDATRMRGLEVSVDAADTTPWTPPAPPRAGAERAAVLAGARRLAVRLAEVGEPAGFAAVLAGRRPPFALDGAAASVAAFAQACARNDAEAAARAAGALIGRGPGLTPAGDDLVGGALFGRLVSADGSAAGWRTAADDVVRAARARTHPVSATLLADHAEGHGHAPLHDLAAALAHGDDGAALAAARRLSHIGHTTGWDVLAGFLVATADGIQRATTP